MALQLYPGPISAEDINLELGRAANAPFSLTGTDERALAGVPTGPISFNDFYGASAADYSATLTAGEGGAYNTKGYSDWLGVSIGSLDIDWIDIDGKEYIIRQICSTPADKVRITIDGSDAHINITSDSITSLTFNGTVFNTSDATFATDAENQSVNWIWLGQGDLPSSGTYPVSIII